MLCTTGDRRDKSAICGVIRNMRRAISLLLVLVVACMAFAGDQGRKVKPGDVVTVRCDEEATLNKQYTIDKSGFIMLPMVGALQIGGLNESDASAKIQNALVEEKILPKATVKFKIDEPMLQNPSMKPAMAIPAVAMIPNPTMSANASTSVVPGANYVTVLGRVGTPRYVPYVDGMTALTAINDAGGSLPHSSSKVRIDRKVDGKTVSYMENEKDVSKGMAGAMPLRANDVVTVRTMDPDEEHILFIALIVLVVVLLLR